MMSGLYADPIANRLSDALVADRIVQNFADELHKSAETPMLSSTHNPLGPNGLWWTPSKKVPVTQALPDYLRGKHRACTNKIWHGRARGNCDGCSGYQAVGKRRSGVGTAQDHA
jgi:hypothetical protein